MRDAIKEQLAQGIPPGQMVISYGEMKWKWSYLLGRWDRVE
jgi:hypothetical protein